MATDIDLPFLPSAAQIRRREFASVRRGYDPDQVRDYLGQVAEQVKGLEQQLQEARLHEGSMEGSPPGPPPSEDPYERLSKRLTTLLATADQEAEDILSEARADAARMINEARTEADRIRVDAQSHAEEARQEGNELLERAKVEADRVVVGLSARRENLVQQLQDMQSRLIGGRKEPLPTWPQIQKVAGNQHGPGGVSVNDPAFRDEGMIELFQPGRKPPQSGDGAPPPNSGQP